MAESVEGVSTSKLRRDEDEEANEDDDDDEEEEEEEGVSARLFEGVTCTTTSVALIMPH